MNPPARRPSTSWLAEVGRKPSFGAKGTQQTVAGVHLPEKLDLKAPRSNSFSVAPTADDEETMHRSRQQFGLSKLREVDDGQESTSSRASSVQSGMKPSGFDSPTEQLQYQLSKNLARRNTSAVIGFQKFAFPNSVPSDNDLAIDDFEDAHHEPKRGPVRRYSEHNSIINPAHSPTRPHEKFKTPMWHANSELVNPEGSQGRRHSFAHIADIDPRSRTTSSNNPHPLRDSINNEDDDGSQVELPQSPGMMSAMDSKRSSDQPYDSRESMLSYFSEPISPLSAQFSSSIYQISPTQSLTTPRRNPLLERHVDDVAAGYFSGHGVAARMLEQSNSPMPVQLASSRSPHGGSHSGQVLVMVSFKCARSDVYYVPDNTGLEVRKGDVVIVEGDRGHDLGTVTHVNVTIQEAKKLKIEAMEEHHRWLMMFSRYFQQHGPNLASFTTAQTSQGRMLGAMAGHGQIAVPENVDVKPRMIKRIAGVYEIQKLQEKEGAEAKAKRLCQQKVVEHGLPMEILDAEYQL